MNSQELQNKLRFKHTELNLIQDPEARKEIQTEIQIINHKIQIERIKETIRKLQTH